MSEPSPAGSPAARPVDTVPVDVVAIDVAPVDIVPVDAEAVRCAALTSTHVVALSAGEHGEAATYLPGGRVVGVQVRDDSVVLHVVARYDVDSRELARDVRSAVAGKVAGRRVDVVIADVALPGEVLEPTTDALP